MKPNTPPPATTSSTTTDQPPAPQVENASISNKISSKIRRNGHYDKLQG
jgi:hypothetical protein